MVVYGIYKPSIKWPTIPSMRTLTCTSYMYMYLTNELQAPKKMQYTLLVLFTHVIVARARMSLYLPTNFGLDACIILLVLYL